MQKNIFDAALEQYDADYISARMSLRKPQKESLLLLERILLNVRADQPFGRSNNLQSALEEVRSIVPTCKDFEREFMSLTFALATGVGKTRLAGAFIVYLHCQFGVKNFFVVAPNITIYEKLRRELSDPSNDKYVFKGAGCFRDTPKVHSEDDYRYMPIDESGVHIYIYNIDKFNSESAKMRQENEVNDAFIKQLSRLDDLILIMDESHHYRAAAGSKALNLLNPVLGLELTATPLMSAKSKQQPFKNIVYNYSLSKAIADGYARMPYALTRRDMENYNFKDEYMDRLMINDGLNWHESIRERLRQYHETEGRQLIKPFVLIVCQNTAHASAIEQMICSKEFRKGYYIGKTLLIHSKQTGAERDENIRQLLEVESADNPIEIVIHVNMLKEGWDVKNLYTIIPLRRAASMILTEQTVGRGIRLPFGECTGDDYIDSVTVTAHDNFNELIEAARSGKSPFKEERIIDAARLEAEKTISTQLALPFKDADIENKIVPLVQRGMSERRSKEDIIKSIEEELSRGDFYASDSDLFEQHLSVSPNEIYKAVADKYISIPRLAVTEARPPSYAYTEFDLDVKDLKQAPSSEAIFIQSLTDARKYFEFHGGRVDIELNPRGMIMQLLREKSRVDYRKCADLLQKLVYQAQAHYESKYGIDGARNILFIYRGSIVEEIYRQLLRHLVREEGLFVEKIVDETRVNRPQSYNYVESVDLYEGFRSDIRSVLFVGIEKGVFDSAKFDSTPELKLARLMEQDANVEKWLRPAPTEFEIKYDGDRYYEPDFVAETPSTKFLIEVKRHDQIDNDDVLKKKRRAVEYCELATEWSKANHKKPWRHLFIPDDKIYEAASFVTIAEQFVVGS